MKTLKILSLIILSTVLPGALRADNPSALWWVMSRSWSNGFTALPDICTDVEEFRSQYTKNKAQWDAMFSWLASHDLLELPAGKHPIEGTSLVASVEDSENKPLGKRRAESHRHHIDFQYVVRGTERFALLDHDSSTPYGDYKPDIMRYDFDRSKAVFFDSAPGRFFLFFPGDWHVAKVATELDSQSIRVIVIKLDYVE